MDKQLKILFWIWALGGIFFSTYIALSTMPYLPLLNPFTISAIAGAVLMYAGGYFFLVSALSGNFWGRFFFVLLVLTNIVSSALQVRLFGGASGVSSEMMANAWFSLVMTVLVSIKLFFEIKRSGNAS
jgi:hypothetical protein